MRTAARRRSIAGVEARSAGANHYSTCPADMGESRVQEHRTLMKRTSIAAAVIFGSLVASAAAQTPQAPPATEPFKPTVGQAGKDVVWVPTPQSLVEKMLDMAKVTPQDFVMDLGSGDGRNIIAAAKRGARAVGVEFNHDMVELARKQAAE